VSTPIIIPYPYPTRHAEPVEGPIVRLGAIACRKDVT